MTKYKIEFIREECIGCSACASVNPDNWTMNRDDAKSHLFESKIENDVETLELEENYDDNLESAESCPVNCIHIYKDDEKII